MARYDDRFGGDLAHVVVMQSADKNIIDELVADLQAEQQADAEELKEAA